MLAIRRLSLSQPGRVRAKVQAPLAVLSAAAEVTSVSPVHRQLLETTGLLLTAPAAPPSWLASWLRFSGPMVWLTGAVRWMVAVIADIPIPLDARLSPEVTDGRGRLMTPATVPA